MKIIVPELTIDESEPFQKDLFGRRNLAERITRLIKNINDSLVISMHSQWGDGKTTFLKMWLAHLKTDGIKAIYFDAFANDYSNEPFLDIMSEVYSFIKSEFSEQESIISTNEKLKKSTVLLGKQLLIWALKASIKSATGAVIEGTDIKKIADNINNISQSASNDVDKIIEEKLNLHLEHKKTIENFKNTLEKLGKEVLAEQEFPLLIVIDELDRCRPSYAVEVIEKIKHFFSSENVVFVLAINEEQIQESIKSVYGQIDAVTYLDKFINLKFALPRRLGNRQVNDYQRYSFYLYNAHGLSQFVDSVGLKEEIVKYFSCYSDHLKLSLRDMERAFTSLVIFYASIDANAIHIQRILCLLSIAKAKYPKEYAAMSSASYTYDALQRDFNIEGIKDISNNYGVDIELLVDTFKSCLFNENQFEELKDSSVKQAIHNLTKKHAIHRREIIPSFCLKMDPFHILGV